MYFALCFFAHNNVKGLYGYTKAAINLIIIRLTWASEDETFKKYNELMRVCLCVSNQVVVTVEWT